MTLIVDADENGLLGICEERSLEVIDMAKRDLQYPAAKLK